MPTQLRSKSPTFGEDLVHNLLKQLPKNDYYWEVEPNIPDKKGVFWKPDFVVAIRHLGVAIIEVKDYVSIIDGDKDNIVIGKRDGSEVTKPNPFQTALDYAYLLSERFEQRADLLHKHKGQTKLKFPWNAFVILPHIDSNTIGAFEDGQIWERGAILGKHNISSVEQFIQALENRHWRFSLKRPLNNATLDTIRGVLNPGRIIIDRAGHDVGTLTHQQEVEVERPIEIEQPQMPSLFGDELSEETRQMVNDQSVRLIRGVAGSGKSLVLARRGGFLAETYPDLKLGVITFNVDLANDLHQRIKNPDVEVINFHKLCRKIIGTRWHSPSELAGWVKRYAHEITKSTDMSAEFIAEELAWRKDLGLFDNSSYLNIERKGRGSGLNQEKRQDINAVFDRYSEYQALHRSQGRNWMDWEDVPHVASDILLNGSSFTHKYDVILIDEAQDFAPSWITVIQNILKPKGTLFICDDPTQSIFRNFTWKEKGINVVGRTRILNIPFRNSYEISRMAHSLIEADPILS